ncbi:hypothetical protein ACC758_39630, partial [Rhizobium ruizarguesonis]
FDQPFQLAIGAIDILEREAHGDEGGIPVPLEGIEPVGRHGIASAIVGGEDALRLVGMRVLSVRPGLKIYRSIRNEHAY